MVNEGKNAVGVCQRCGGTRGPSRYCPHCGLDFWKAAEELARGTTAPDPDTTPALPVERQDNLPFGMVAIGAGIALLVVAVLVWVVAGGGLRRDTGPQLGQHPPPASHPLVLAFFAEARDPDAAYSWRQSGETTVTIPDEEFASTIHAAGRADGEDWTAKLRVVENGEPAFDGEVTLVSKRGYVRADGEPWVETGKLPAAQLGPVNPFARITTVNELEYVGPETREGVDGHILTSDKWLNHPEADDPIRRVAHVRSREALMEIFVNADGVPLSALYTFAIEARTPGGELVTLAGESRYRFDDWGAVEPITAPTTEPAP